MQHLLIVEDDKIDQLAFERFVEKTEFAYTYKLTGSIKDAKKTLKEQTFDAIVTDYFLGDGTAFELLELHLDIPFIIVTGTGSEAIAVDAMKKGAYDYLIKDIDGHYLNMLPVTIQHAINRYRAEKENKEYHLSLELLVKERTIELEKEIALKEEHEIKLKKFSKTVEQTPSSIIITDTNGIIEYVNPMFTEITEYTKEEAIGKKTNLLKSDKHSTDFYKNIWKTIKSGKKWVGEFQNLKKNGTLFWETAAISPIFNTKNEIINFVKISEDSTYRKMADIELKKTVAQYEKLKKSKGKLPQFSAIYLLLISSGFIFIYELILMFFLNYVIKVPEIIKFLLDGLLISILIFPVLYYFLLRPLKIHSVLSSQIEQELKKSEIKYKSLINQIGDGMFIVDQYGIMSFLNENVCAMLEYKMEEIENKLTPFSIIKEEYLELFNEKCLQTYKGITSFYELKLKKKSGDFLWVEMHQSPNINIDGNIVGHVCLVHEITNRKKTEEKLKINEERLTQAQKIGKLGYIDWNLITDELIASDETLRIYGIYEDLKKPTLNDFIKLLHPADRERTTTSLNNTIEGKEKHRIEHRIIQPNGTVIWVDASAQVFKDSTDKPFRLLGTIQDITERKNSEQIQKVLYNISAENNISHNLNHFLSIIQTEIGTLIDTSNFFIAFYNQTNNTFYSPFISKENDNIDTWQAHKSLSGYVINSKKTILLSEKEILRLIKIGEIELIGKLPKTWLGTPLFINKEPIGVVVVQSYTNEKAYSKFDKGILQFVSNQISQSIYRKKKEDETIKALEKAEENDRLKTAFLQNMSHEIRTPMNGILGFTGLLENPDLTSEKQQQYISIISKSSKRLLNILNDLMDISKLETGQVKINLKKTNINEELTNLYNYIHYRSNAARIIIQFKQNASR